MTWRGERRKQLPSNWAALRKARLELDGYRCTFIIGSLDFEVFADRDALGARRCTARATDVDHALDPSDHRIEALRSLCDPHHKMKTQAEAAQAQGRGTTRFRPTKKHPGLR